MSLPELVTLESYRGDWSLYVEALYDIFQKEIARNLTFLGFPVRSKFMPATDNKHFRFWHLISEGEKENDRLPDLKRCERLRWITYVLENADNRDLVKCWESSRGSQHNIVLWLKEHDYVVILGRRSTYFALLSAYIVDQPHRKRKLEQEIKNLPDPRKS